MGRDLLTRVLYGARMSMVVGLTATTLAVGLATFLGTSECTPDGQKYWIYGLRLASVWYTIGGV